jgi:hypothetical protein
MMMSDIGYWWCKTCKCEVKPLCVTFTEHHDNCGGRVEWLDGSELGRIAELEADRDRWKNRHELNMKNENLRIAKLEAENKIFRSCESVDDNVWDGMIRRIADLQTAYEHTVEDNVDLVRQLDARARVIL